MPTASTESTSLYGERGGSATADRGASPRRWRLLVAGLILLLPVVVLAGAWRLGGASALEDDLLYYLPIRTYIGERLRAGEWPLWNPWSALGTSIAADPQAGLWYPTTWLFAILSPRVAYPLTLCLHFALAGAGMYRFLRACRHRREAALLAALAFELGGFMVAQRAHLTIHHAAAWLPWMLCAWHRFAESGRFRYFALASLALGLQLLVQHLQVTIISGVLVSAYVVHLLCMRNVGAARAGPRRPWALLWVYPLSLAVALLISAVQWLPTFHQFAGSGRSAASYHLFIENAWMPSSAILSVFPMIFGSRTPNLWSEPWWGLSHFCEQSAYASILILILALASPALPAGPLRRQARFWWFAILIALLLALGPLTPLSSLLFHVPVYRNLRVPARWLLVVSVALPVLASCTLTAMLRYRRAGSSSLSADISGPGARLAARLRVVSLRWLPIAACAVLAGLVIARLLHGTLSGWMGGWYEGPRLLAGLRSAIRWDNPALWWPLLILAGTAGLLLRWMRRGGPAGFAALLAMVIVDLAAVAGFVDVDFSTYTWRNIVDPPPLARELHALDSTRSYRLLVPRRQADYARPVEILSPQTNLLHGVATANGYGPLSPVSQRLLLRFMPWGASENVIALLRNRPLLRALGVRFLAARSLDERICLAAANWPELHRLPEVIFAGDAAVDLVSGDDLLYPVTLDGPGLYEMTLDALPAAGAASRWFIGLEDPAGKPLADTQSVEPVDLSAGPRALRLLFLYGVRDVVDPTIEANPPEGVEVPARVRLKSERGHAAAIGRVTFRRLTAMPADPLRSSASPDGGSTDLEAGMLDIDGLTVMEVTGAVPAVYWAAEVTAVDGPLEAVQACWSGASALTTAPEAVGHFSPRPADAAVAASPLVVVEGATAGEASGGGPARDFVAQRVDSEELRVSVDAPRGGWVVFNETFDPGWSTRLDGAEVPVRRTNAVFQAVRVPPGRHEAVFRYRPPGLSVGLALSAAGVAALVLGAVGARARGRAGGRRSSL